MAVLTFILLVHILNYTLATNCVIDNTPEYITWEKQLLEDLKCGYSPLHAPSENTVVNVTYFIKSFNFDSEEEVMSIQTWLGTKWKDERLKWDPEKYNGINDTDVSNFHIWTPMFGITNADDFLNFYLSFYKYILNSNGDVHCQHLLVEEARCSVKLTNWPYDAQECIFEFEKIKYSVQTGNYTINFDFQILESKTAEWYIYDYKHEQENSTKSKAKLIVFLRREAVGLSAIVISPILVLTVLSILSLCLDVRRKVRLAIACFSLLGHYYFLTELSYDIPKESQFPPTLLLYYRGSVILTVLIILSTYILAKICRLKSTPDRYVQVINYFVYENNYRSYLVFPRWDFDDGTVDSKSSSEDWVKFANIVNSVLMYCIVFTYIGLYGSMIPKQTPHEVNDDYY